MNYIRNNYGKILSWVGAIALEAIAIVGIAKHVDAKMACPISNEVKRVQAQPGDSVDSLLRRESNYDGRCDIHTLEAKFDTLNGQNTNPEHGGVYVIPLIETTTPSQ